MKGGWGLPGRKGGETTERGDRKRVSRKECSQINYTRVKLSCLFVCDTLGMTRLTHIGFVWKLSQSMDESWVTPSLKTMTSSPPSALNYHKSSPPLPPCWILTTSLVLYQPYRQPQLLWVGEHHSLVRPTIRAFVVLPHYHPAFKFFLSPLCDVPWALEGSVCLLL